MNVKRPLAIAAAGIVAATMALFTGAAAAAATQGTTPGYLRKIATANSTGAAPETPFFSTAKGNKEVVAAANTSLRGIAAGPVVTTAQRGEGVIRITTRICGNANNWQAVAAANNIVPPVYLVRLGQSITVTCSGSAVPAPQLPPAAPQAPAASSGWTHPLPGHCVGSNWGWRNGRMHQGVDLGAGTGTNVLAAAAGTAYHGNDPDGAGLYIIIDHGNGVWTTYFHLSARVVGNGVWVAAGQHIGEVGSTGNSTGPHLHYEMHLWGKWVKVYDSGLGTNVYAEPIWHMGQRGVTLNRC